MKLLLLSLTIIAFLSVNFCYGQTIKERAKVKEQSKIVLSKETIAKDSALATWPVIVSLMENDALSRSKTEAIVNESFGEYSIKFNTNKEKGIITVYFENLPKNIYPDLFLTDTKGKEIYKIKAKTRLNVINLRKLPAGKYLFTTDVNKEVTTWEVVKE
jgi:hypothetical protein